MFGHDNQKDDHKNDDDVAQDDNQVPTPDEHLDSEAHSDDAQLIAPNDNDQAAADDSSSDPQAADDSPAPSDDVMTPSGNDDLIAVKQQALQDLSPLVDHLDQTPEEKFKTTMMMIQASDDKNLVQAAYEAAKQISDDKVRAQALLDVINEINYFTQPQNG